MLDLCAFGGLGAKIWNGNARRDGNDGENEEEFEAGEGRFFLHERDSTHEGTSRGNGIFVP